MPLLDVLSCFDKSSENHNNIRTERKSDPTSSKKILTEEKPSYLQDSKETLHSFTINTFHSTH